MSDVLFIAGEVATVVIIIGLIVAIAKQREAVANLSDQVRILDSHIDETWDVLEVLEQRSSMTDSALSDVIIEVNTLRASVKKPAARKPAVKKTVVKKEAK